MQLCMLFKVSKEGLVLYDVVVVQYWLVNNVTFLCMGSSTMFVYLQFGLQLPTYLV